MIEVMRSIDVSYRALSGLSAKGDYKIFYSHLHPFPILVLGLNPGGASDGANLAASDGYFEQWEHDYPRFRETVGYALARPICQLLSTTLATIPATNVIFRRSKRIDALPTTQMAGAMEAKVSLERIIQVVDPRVILFISKMAYDLFTKVHCRSGTLLEDGASIIRTPNGLNPACIFLRARGLVNALARPVELLTVGHPSRYAGRVEWASVTSALRSTLEDMGLSPIERAGVLIPIPRLPDYGESL